MANMKGLMLLIIVVMVGVWRRSQNTIFKKTSDNNKFKTVIHFYDRFEPTRVTIKQIV